MVFLERKRQSDQGDERSIFSLSEANRPLAFLFSTSPFLCRRYLWSASSRESASELEIKHRESKKFLLFFVFSRTKSDASLFFPVEII